MNITLSVQSAQAQRPGAYRTDITVTGVNGVSTAYLFVKRRTMRPDGTFDDTFITVASPSQIKDLPESAPDSPDTYFRDYVVSLISNNPELLDDIVTHVLNDLQITVQQLSDLATFTTTINYTIDSVTGITVT